MTKSKLSAALVAALGAGLALSVSPVAAGTGHDHGSHAGHDHAVQEKTPTAKVKVKATAPTGDAALVHQQLPSYPLDTCPISGEALDWMGKPHDFVHEGRLVRTCCSDCENAFAEDPAAVLAKIDAAVIEAQLPTYPATHCPISGMELGGMGEPYNHVSGTRLVRFCCAGCLPKFEADPATAMAKVDEALIQAQLADYPTDMCPVMAMKNDVMGEPFHILHGTRLVSLCCEACVEQFRKDPAKYLAKLDAVEK